MERIDSLESQVRDLNNSLQEISQGNTPKKILSGEAQNLKDKEIIQFLGDNVETN